MIHTCTVASIESHVINATSNFECRHGISQTKVHIAQILPREMAGVRNGAKYSKRACGKDTRFVACCVRRSQRLGFGSACGPPDCLSRLPLQSTCSHHSSLHSVIGLETVSELLSLVEMVNSIVGTENEMWSPIISCDVTAKFVMSYLSVKRASYTKTNGALGVAVNLAMTRSRIRAVPQATREGNLADFEAAHIALVR